MKGGNTMDLFWLFPLLCGIFMIGMMFMMFRHGMCMSMHYGPGTGRGDERETVRQILDRRFASGEIAREQYETLKRALQTSGEMK
jgi:putative membrane protein